MFEFLDRIADLEKRLSTQILAVNDLRDELTRRIDALDARSKDAYEFMSNCRIPDEVEARFRGRNGLLSYKNLRRNPVDAPEDVEVERY